MKRLILAGLALALSACVTAPPVPSTTAAPAPAKLVSPAAVDAAADTAAALADAAQLAPPATLTARVQIPATYIDRAFRSFDAALTIVDAARDTGLLVPGTPLALTIQRRGREVQAALNAVSAAQRIQSATSYREALTRARAALAAFSATLTR